MITVPEIIKEILFIDISHMDALIDGTLNLNAYAKKIHKEVELRTKKKVNLGTIVIGLSRISNDLNKLPKLRPLVRIDNLSVKSGLTVINYEKTNKNIQILSKATINRKEKEFFVISESIAEIAIIASDKNISFIEQLLPSLPKSKFDNAIAITLTFNESYIVIPNILYTFVSSLAVKRINLLEIVSTLTEVSFILESKYLDDAVNVFKHFLN